MSKSRIVVALLALLPALSTCTKDIGGVGACFDEDVLPIFVSNCTMSGCHNAVSKAEGYDLSNYEGIMKGVSPGHPLLSEVFKSIKGHNPSMPPDPYPKLGEKELNTIRYWIKAGAKNTSNCHPCDTSVFSYNGKIKDVMATWCTGCHHSGNASGGYDLSSYAPVVQAATDGKLMGSIRHLPGYIAMPQNGGSLSQCDINAIQKWIDNGFPQN